MAVTGRPEAGGEVDRHAAVARPSSPAVLLITWALVVLLGGLPANTEVIFHRRDHRDQGKYLSNQPVYHVQSYFDALVSHALHILRSNVISGNQRHDKNILL